MARFPPRAGRGRLALALWFLLLSAVVVLLATWVAGELAERQERESADTRLATNLRAGQQEFETALDEGQEDAEGLARAPDVQRALAESDPAAAERALAGSENAALVTPGGDVLAGGQDWIAERAVEVTGDGGRSLGRVVAGLAANAGLARRLADAAGLEAEDALAVVEETTIAAAFPSLSGEIPVEGSGMAEAGGDRYRYLSAPLVDGTNVRLAALTPDAPISEAASDARRRALVAALATVIGLGLVVLAVTALLRRRAPAASEPEEQRRRAADARGERDSGDRVREAVALVGDALAATHDPEALLPVILQSAIEATGAAGARLVSGGRELAQAGEPERGGRPLLLRLGDEDDAVGRLLLYPPPNGSFDRDAQELAQWLAGQASIALENERLHRTVKTQAITDELTQLANRRRFTETLALEVRRAARFGDPLALVMADLDDFKLINDRYGHGVGDEVLRGFADVLRANVRDFDLPVRYGGEEFAVLLPETGLDGGVQLARRLQATLAKLRIPAVRSDGAPVTASFGVAAFPAAATAEDLVAEADRALYRAKAEGKNRVTGAAAESDLTASS